jgi:hypothetical protein
VGGASSISLPFKGLELNDESLSFKWEWFSEPLDCPSNERCKPESMREPSPFRAGRKSEEHLPVQLI